MKTNIKNINYTYNKYEIIEKIKVSIEIINNWVEKNNYQIIGQLNDNIEWVDISKRKMKQIQKYCFWINEKRTLKNVNSFLSLSHKYFNLERAQIKISLKEEQIQKARKDWLKSRNESDRLLKIYKEEKSDFYLLNKN